MKECSGNTPHSYSNQHNISEQRKQTSQPIENFDRSTDMKGHFSLAGFGFRNTYQSGRINKIIK